MTGTGVDLPDPDRLIHLQFRRFAGCPVCNLHLRSIVRRHAEIEAAGVREVVLFHSPPTNYASTSPICRSPWWQIRTGGSTGSSVWSRRGGRCSTRAPGCRSCEPW
ncbi:hypothetical protein V2I01_10735 [Micromonospora sp. BRA006-A]|nr:hypothetical protein [Micromonospora sp. BRA006-A]